MKLIYFLLVMLFSHATYANPYTFNILRVIDGDTLEIEASFMPDPLPKKLLIRIYGIDTPEKGSKAKCSKENNIANIATKFTIKTIQDAKAVGIPIFIELRKHDKYGGRILGDIIINNKRLSRMLIEKGLARPYYGDKKGSWCE